YKRTMTIPSTNQPRKERSDADPVIDALLAEFVPSSAARRLRPPNLTAKILAQLASSEPAEDTESKRFEALEDSDPLIDSLLAEFLPSDSAARITPPDLSAKILEQLASIGDVAETGADLIDDGDPVIDGLLPEFVPAELSKRKAPPNLSDVIMAQLAGVSESVDSPVTTRAFAAEPYALTRTVSLLAAIAASIIAVIWLTAQPNGQNGLTQADHQSVVSDDLGDNGDRLNSEPNRIDDSDRIGVDGLASNDQQGSRSTNGMGIVLENPGSTDLLPDSSDRIESPVIAANPEIKSTDRSLSGGSSISSASETPVTLVAEQAAETAYKYWNAIGVTPTPEAQPNEVASRLKTRLGVDLPEQALADPERLRDLLASSSNADEITKRWLALTTGHSAASFAKPENKELVDELAAGIGGQSQLDVTLVSLIDGTNSQSSRWYETIGKGGNEGIAKHLASISINADLRCVRCHDSHIGRSGTQDDYWSFVAMVNNFVVHKDGRWTVSDVGGAKSTFFELLDGRQKLASPKVSGYLLQSPDEITDFRTWAQTLVGSDALAGSMVDSLWRLVHGRPLKPSPVDAFAPPVDGNLDRLHRLLADDLKNNGFDVARTLALIISSPMARRSVPEALVGDAMLTASDKQHSEALELVAAFAGTVQTPPSALKDRVDVAMRRIGGRLSSDAQGTFLAQPDLQGSRDPKSRPLGGGPKPGISFEQQLSVDFPSNDAPLPVSWLRSIDDFDRKVHHLVYLSGRDSVPPEIIDAARRMRESGSEASALSRTWWILRD
ncbi:MAG: hypothetical protein KDB00_09375, partial [Planctomycetales bacterium]|nr:hypothetical protein [Planctomycetales bacterium]